MELLFPMPDTVAILSLLANVDFDVLNIGVGIDVVVSVAVVVGCW